MAPEHLRFGGGAAGTLLHPLVALAMLAVIVILLGLPRKYAITAFLASVFLIPLGQVVVVGGVHFTVLRILIIAGLARKATRRDRTAKSRQPKGTSIDLLVSLWFGLIFASSSLELMESQAVIKGLGDFLDAVGGYFVLRTLIQDRNDILRAVKTFAVLTVILGVFMVNEQVTQQNLFGIVLGGAATSPQIRDGKLRSQAAFGVYIDAGVFGATLIPLFIWLWSDRRNRSTAVLGLVGGLIMMITCNSSTPLLAVMGAVVGLCLWPIRNSLRFVRWGIVLTLAALHMVMKGPVWSLIARVDLTGSSSGYHRYYLVDNCIRHFNDWWLIGYKDYPNWGWDMWDLSDQYVAVALCGGLAALFVFFWVLKRSFAALGNARKSRSADRKQQWFLWCLGATLLAHVVGWFGCSYMAQMQILLFAFWAICAVALKEAMQPAPANVQTGADEAVQVEQFWALPDQVHGAALS